MRTTWVWAIGISLIVIGGCQSENSSTDEDELSGDISHVQDQSGRIYGLPCLRTNRDAILGASDLGQAKRALAQCEVPQMEAGVRNFHGGVQSYAYYPSSFRSSYPSAWSFWGRIFHLNTPYYSENYYSPGYSYDYYNQIRLRHVFRIFGFEEEPVAVSSEPTSNYFDDCVDACFRVGEDNKRYRRRCATRRCVNAVYPVVR